MIFELHPPRAAGPLRIGATGHDTVEILKRLSTPQVLCRTPGSRPAWAVHRLSGLTLHRRLPLVVVASHVPEQRPALTGAWVVDERQQRGQQVMRRDCHQVSRTIPGQQLISRCLIRSEMRGTYIKHSSEINCTLRQSGWSRGPPAGGSDAV
jgi:hypothetical protein